MVIGESEKHTSALISPNKEALRNWCKEKNISGTNTDEMIAHPQVYEHYKNIVNAFNKHLSEDEHVKRFKLVKEEWTPVTGELSPTLKLKRKVIKEKYKTLIDEIFNH